MNKQVTIFIWNKFLDFYIQPGQISEKIFFQMIILAVLSENTVQRPQMLLWILLYIYIFLIASFRFFVHWIDLDSKKPLQLAHSGYQDNKNFETKVWDGSLVFNISHFCWNKIYTANFPISDVSQTPVNGPTGFNLLS